MDKCKSKLNINDNVEILCGKDKGKIGKILLIDRRIGKVIVERVNMIKRHTKSKVENKGGQIIEKEAFIDISNIVYICPECDHKSNIVRSVNKIRTCNKCVKIK